MIKNSYPNLSSPINQEPTKDINKWSQAMRQIYTLLHYGHSKHDAFDNVTKAWGHKDKLQFLNWMKFYEEKTPAKYKIAFNDSGEQFKAPENILNTPNSNNPNTMDLSAIKENPNHDNAEFLKKQEFDSTKKKFLSRLDSLEKLLRQKGNVVYEGTKLNQLLTSIYNLKLQLHNHEIQTSQAKTAIDLIYRESNKLKKLGNDYGANVLVKFAQAAQSAQEQNPSVLNTKSPPPGPIPGAPNSTNNPPAPANTPPPPPPVDLSVPPAIPSAPSEDPTKPKKPALDKFVKKMQGDFNSSDDDFLVTAQLAPQENVLKPAVQQERSFEDLVETVFSNVKLSDVINKLEELSRIFKTREISRQLAIVDMMLDKLGLASFFPNLSEATNKTLEANQYVLTRIEDVLSTLRGALDESGTSLHDSHSTNTTGNKVTDLPDVLKGDAVDNLKNKLTELEKKKEDKRRAREDELLNEPTQNPGIAPEQSTPVIAPAKPLPAQPIPQPKALV